MASEVGEHSDLLIRIGAGVLAWVDEAVAGRDVEVARTELLQLLGITEHFGEAVAVTPVSEGYRDRQAEVHRKAVAVDGAYAHTDEEILAHRSAHRLHDLPQEPETIFRTASGSVAAAGDPRGG